MKKSVIWTAMVIVGVASLAAVGTYADFNDIETSEGNSVQMGDLNLRLENPQGIGAQDGEGVLRTWHFSQKLPPSDPTLSPWYGRMEPGDSLSSYLYLEADGSLEGDHVDIYCSNVNEELDMDTEPENLREDQILGYDVPRDPNNGVWDKDTVMVITYMRYHVTPVIWNGGHTWNQVCFGNVNPDDNGDGWISLDEFESHPLLNMTPAPNSGTIMFAMDVLFLPGEWNEYQGDRTNMTLMFTLIK